MESQKKRKLVLADGSEYIGLGFGSDKEAVCELVFNTSMASYQEILSDPSYTDQFIALSYGAKTYKLKFGHRGGNHPVQNLSTGKIEMTSQNHSFAVDENSLSGTGLVITHKNLLDNTIEGLAHESEPTFSVQYHPESAPGPNDGSYLFGQFLKLMGDVKSGNYKPMRGED